MFAAVHPVMAATSTAGARPKLTRSAMVSKSLPNLLVTPRRLATAPSIRSKPMAAKFNRTPVFNRPWLAYHMANSPQMRLLKVKSCGISRQIGCFALSGMTRIATEILASTSAVQISKFPTTFNRGTLVRIAMPKKSFDRF